MIYYYTYFVYIPRYSLLTVSCNEWLSTVIIALPKPIPTTKHLYLISAIDIVILSDTKLRSTKYEPMVMEDIGVEKISDTLKNELTISLISLSILFIMYLITTRQLFLR